MQESTEEFRRVQGFKRALEGAGSYARGSRKELVGAGGRLQKNAEGRRRVQEGS